MHCLAEALKLHALGALCRLYRQAGAQASVWQARGLKYLCFCRVVMTPHVAGVTELSYRTMAQVVANEVRRHARGLPPTIQLNHVSKAIPDAL